MLKRCITRGDLLLIAALTLLSFAGFGWSRLAGSSGSHVVVEVEGKKALELPIDRDGEFSVNGPLGKTTVEVKGGAVFIIESPCPRSFCKHMGKIRYPGEILVCVPNRVCVSIKGNGRTDKAYDGVSE